MPRLWDDESDDAFWDSDDAVWDADEEQPAMNNNNQRLYRCPDSLLYSESGLIIDACEADAAVIARLPAGVIAAARQALADALAATSGQQNNTTELDGLTAGQDAALAAIKLKSTLARDTAKQAFRGQKTKLSEQFGVGEKPQNLAAHTALALRIHAGCTDADNAPALAVKGWLAADSTALEAAILTLTGADSIQEARKAVNKGGTMDLVAVNNSLFESVTAMQNACAIQHPAQSSADTIARQAFRIGIFPPVTPRALPTIPKKLTARPLDTGSLKIFVDYNVATRATDYLITARNKATGEVLLTLETEDNKATLTFTGVTPGTEVEITVTARNEAGPSKPAGPVTATVP